MDCSHARLLLLFNGPGPSEFAAEEAKALRSHLEECPDCRTRAEREERADAALSKAMVEVPVPGGLEARILKKLRRQRPPSPWPWVAAAAVLLISAGIGAGLYYRPVTVTLDHRALVEAHSPGARADVVENWFRKQGVPMAMPPGFDDKYLKQGEHFQDNAIAHVYVIPRGAFRIDSEFTALASSANMALEESKNGTFIFLTKYTRGQRGAFMGPFN
jgi:hypothetical protein